MRLFEIAAIVASPMLAGCAIPLETPPSPEPASPTPPKKPAVKAGCRLFDGAVTPPSGPGRSIAVDGKWRWIFDGAAWPGGSAAALSALVPGGAPASCFSGSPLDALPIDASSLGANRIVTPLDGATMGAVEVLYLQVYDLAPEEPFGVRAAGIAIATRGDPQSPYAATGFLWTADRATFGTSVLREDGYLYAYGCRAEGLTSRCEVARAPEAQAPDPSAYRYADGGGNWITDIEQSAPLVMAGPIASVRHDLSRDRYLMSDVPALGGVVELRVGLGPAGPWSKPIDAFACDVPGDDAAAFCTGAVQHPEAAGDGEIALSYGLASLSADASARVAASPERYWPRLVTLPWPKELP